MSEGLGTAARPADTRVDDPALALVLPDLDGTDPLDANDHP